MGSVIHKLIALLKRPSPQTAVSHLPKHTIKIGAKRMKQINLKEDLIITLAGDLCIERLQELAAQVVVER